MLPFEIKDYRQRLIVLRGMGKKRAEADAIATDEIRKGILPPAHLSRHFAPRSYNGGAVAIILGGAECVWDDLAKTRELLGAAEARYFAVNDMIAAFPDDCIAVTIHADKLRYWQQRRAQSGFVMPREYWSHLSGRRRYREDVTHCSHDWRGSSGLLAVKIAREKGHRRIILCGVPMTVSGGHFVRHEAFIDASGFYYAWEKRWDQLAPFVRSWSGWTADVFGFPTEDFINAHADLRDDLHRHSRESAPLRSMADDQQNAQP